MSIINKIHTSIANILLLAVSLFIITACNNDDDSNIDSIPNEVSWKGSTTLGVGEGSIAMVITGTPGTEWSAEITEGGSWCSFNYNSTSTTISGAISEGLNVKYVYYKANTTSNSRSAIITFTFQNSEPQTVTLTQIATGEQNNIPFGRWAELPAYKAGSNYQYVLHYTPLNNETVRNYSFCYDINKKAALWVAYPLHNCYLGSVKRTDAWAFDPVVPEKYQPNLLKSYKGSYDRGHQLPSADRVATKNMNIQTFYFTNMTPQLDRLNQDMWANLESKVRLNNCSDTLYVVTGAHFGPGALTTTDGAGNVVQIPTNYYKVLLRSKTGKTGKPISELSESDIISIGFWVNQENYGNIQPPTSICTTVADIEAKTGFKFFPKVSDAVKKQKNPAQWGIN